MAQGFEDERGGGACISEHKRIADAQNTPAEAVEQRGALGIVFDLTSHIVRWAIDFDDQLRLHAGKVSDITADRPLAAKFKTKTIVAHDFPNGAFSAAWLFAHASGAVSEHAFGWRLCHPSPYPLPSRGEGSLDQACKRRAANTRLVAALLSTLA